LSTPRFQARQRCHIRHGNFRTRLGSQLGPPITMLALAFPFHEIFALSVSFSH
jgi:hypothetical protein